MSETIAHMRLVGHINAWLINQAHCDPASILLASPDMCRDAIPIKIDKHIPDAIVKLHHQYGVIIGEAKTWNDIETPHTESQLSEFLKFCSIHKASLLVLAVPWNKTILAQAILQDLMLEHSINNVDIKVLERLVV